MNLDTFGIGENKIKEISEIKENKTFLEKLKKLKKEELINIIDELTKDDKLAKRKIMLKYDKKRKIKDYKIIIDKIIKKYTYDSGEIKYGKGERLKEELEDIVSDIYAEENLNVAIEVTNQVLKVIKDIEVYSENEYEENEMWEIKYLLEDIWKINIKNNPRIKEEMFNKIAILKEKINE